MEGLPDQRRAVEVKSTNVISVEHRLTADSRAVRNGHHGGVLWFTGLSGAGKSTLAMEVEQQLFAKGYQVYVLDGDNVRRSEEHTSELQSLMRISYAVFCLKKKKQ